jgi:hypothetical protein
MSKNPKKNKRPRLQTTAASDVGPTQQFTHSSNTSTRTRQIVTRADFLASETTNMTSPRMEMDSDIFDQYPVTEEVDHPAGVEVLTKAKRYVNSVWIWL